LRDVSRKYVSISDHSLRAEITSVRDKIRSSAILLRAAVLRNLIAFYRKLVHLLQRRIYPVKRSS